MNTDQKLKVVEALFSTGLICNVDLDDIVIGDPELSDFLDWMRESLVASIESGSDLDTESDRVRLVWDRWENDTGFLRAAIPDIPNRPDELAHAGSCVIFAVPANDLGFGYSSPVLTNPTWGTILRYFDESIRVTGDRQICLFKGLLSPEMCPVELVGRVGPDVHVYKFIAAERA
jgi:hypothetical protein